MEQEMEPSSDGISTTWLLIYTAIALFVIRHLYGLTNFWRLGIPGPMPLPLLGNMLAFKQGFLVSLEKWSKKYGTNFGVYAGTMDFMVSTDVDMAKQVLIKDFSSFSARSAPITIKYLSDSLSLQEGAAWKRARSYVSPTFSGSKMKQMMPGLNEQCESLIKVLDKIQENGDTFETKETFGSYVMDCVAVCAFGVKANCQQEPENNQFHYHAKNMISPSMFSPARFLSMVAPSLLPVASYFGMDLMKSESSGFFVDIVNRIVELRKEGGAAVEGKKKDFIQLMIDAAETGEGEEETTHRAVKKIPQTTDELVGQSLMFFLAGYETVSTTLGFMTYALAANPEIQVKLQEEIDEMVQKGKPIEYDTVFKLEYLDKVWCETLRIWPIAYVLKRLCTKDYNYKGLHIPEKQFINFYVWGIHHDPQHWPDPDTFDPERFTKEAKESRHPCAYMPFGSGPRNCVGMRFAVLEGKLALIHMLQKYSFELLPNAPDLCDINNLGKMLLHPSEGIHIRPVLRN